MFELPVRTINLTDVELRTYFTIFFLPTNKTLSVASPNHMWWPHKHVVYLEVPINLLSNYFFVQEVEWPLVSMSYLQHELSPARTHAHKKHLDMYHHVLKTFQIFNILTQKNWWCKHHHNELDKARIMMVQWNEPKWCNKPSLAELQHALSLIHIHLALLKLTLVGIKKFSCLSRLEVDIQRNKKQISFPKEKKQDLNFRFLAKIDIQRFVSWSWSE